MGLFDHRLEYKPFEYPFAVGYKEAIQNTPWLVTKWGHFDSDCHQFKIEMDDYQRQVVKRAILAISQVEVGVKKFWGRLGDRFPKAEFEAVGAVFAESEERHASAYSRILEVLGLNQEFDTLKNQPAISERVAHLGSILKEFRSVSNRDFSFILALFSLLVENVSLFSQFLVVKSFNKHLGLLKDIDNVIQETAQEERVHALFGAELFNTIVKENPDWFTPAYWENLKTNVKMAFDLESKIVDWIYGDGELPHMNRVVVKEFAKKRLNDSLSLIGLDPLFTIDSSIYSSASWFDEELNATISTDFFHKNSPNYSVLTKSITAEDLF